MRERMKKVQLIANDKTEYIKDLDFDSLLLYIDDELVYTGANIVIKNQSKGGKG
jgi:hypothetical protein